MISHEETPQAKCNRNRRDRRKSAGQCIECGIPSEAYRCERCKMIVRMRYHRSRIGKIDKRTKAYKQMKQKAAQK